MIPEEQNIVLFDGVCNLCNSTVDRIIRNDKKERFLFCSLQSEEGKNLLIKYGIDSKNTDSIVLLEGKAYSVRSTAALRIAKKMGGLYPILFGAIILPESWRDGIYNWIAKNRYRWFGKREQCRVPTPEIKKRFISS